jgi:signal transduction histidine kinase
VRPWYVWCITALALLTLLFTAGRLLVVWNGAGTGVTIDPRTRRVLSVRPGGALDAAGVRAGDLLPESPLLAAGGRVRRYLMLRWGRLPYERPLRLLVQRGGRMLIVNVLPRRPPGPVRLVWALLGALHVCWCILAMVVLWQHPRDQRAVLLSLVLLGAQSLFVPMAPRPLILAVTLHLFLAFPSPLGGAARRRALWAIYVPAVVVGLITAGPAQLRFAPVSDALCLVYAAIGCWVCWRQLQAGDGQRAAARTLLAAAVSVFAATVLAAMEPAWPGSEWLLPLSLLPAAIFGLAVADLLFRLHALDVRLFLRQSAQYALARWALTVLFTAPVLILTFRLGRMSAGEHASAGSLLPYASWVLAVVLLGGFRGRLLAALDRRFFRDEYRAQAVLAGMGRALSDAATQEAILRTAGAALDHAFHAGRVWLAPPAEGLRAVVGGRNPPQSGVEGAEVAVPLRRGEQDFGYLALGRKQSGLPYTSEDRRLLDAVAAQLAIALDGARLRQALLEQQRRELEMRSRGLLEGAEDERRRLAADLHDHVLPDLRHIAGEAERVREQTSGSVNGLGEELERLEETTRAAMDGVREVMEALRPSALDVLGFTDALESVLRQSAARACPPLVAGFRRRGPDPSLTPEQSLALFRILQEAINNVVAHARASQVSMEITTEGTELTIRLADDGVGAADRGGWRDGETESRREGEMERRSEEETERRSEEETERRSEGRGMVNMRYRAQLIGATVQWLPNDGRGSVVEVRLPLEA